MTADEFRAALDDLNLTPTALARLMVHLGDPTDLTSLRRRFHKWISGSSRVPGEMTVLLNLLRQLPEARALTLLPDLHRPRGRPKAVGPLAAVAEAAARFREMAERRRKEKSPNAGR